MTDSKDFAAERRLQCEKVSAPHRLHHAPDFRAGEG